PPSTQISGVQYFRMSEVSGLSNDNSGRIIPYSRPLPEFQDWEYLNPIPTEELTLNPNLNRTLDGINMSIMNNKIKITFAILISLLGFAACGNKSEGGQAENTSSINEVIL